METSISWRNLYAAAMLELDHAHLGTRIREAQAAIQRAIDEQLAVHDNHAAEELQALTDAMHNLATLQRAVAIPSPNSGGLHSKRVA